MLCDEVEHLGPVFGKKEGEQIAFVFEVCVDACDGEVNALIEVVALDGLAGNGVGDELACDLEACLDV